MPIPTNPNQPYLFCDSNPVKYTTGNEPNALKKGNWRICTGDVDKGPTNTSGFWNSITPPQNGWTIYLNKASNGPAVYTATNLNELESIARSAGYSSVRDAGQIVNWFRGEPDKLITNIEYDGLVTTGLKIALDSGNSASYANDASDRWFDMVDDVPYQSSVLSDPAWANAIDEITICCLLQKTATTQDRYAWHPISKWNNGYLANAAFVLYQFDDYLGNGNDGILGWYGYTQNAGWTNISPTYTRMFPNQTLLVTLRYSSTMGGELWVNNANYGSVGPRGQLAPSNGNPTGSIGCYGPLAYVSGPDSPLKVHQALFYNRWLSDAELFRNYWAVNQRIVV